MPSHRRRRPGPEASSSPAEERGDRPALVPTVLPGVFFRYLLERGVTGRTASLGGGGTRGARDNACATPTTTDPRSREPGRAPRIRPTDVSEELGEDEAFSAEVAIPCSSAPRTNPPRSVPPTGRQQSLSPSALAA